MQSELVALQPQLVKTVGEVEQLMVKISKEKAEVVEPKVSGRGGGEGKGGSGEGDGPCQWKCSTAKMGLFHPSIPFAPLPPFHSGHPSIPVTPPSPPPQAAIVKVDEANAQEKANAAKAIKDECESDLAEVRGDGGMDADLVRQAWCGARGGAEARGAGSARAGG